MINKMLQKRTWLKKEETRREEKCYDLAIALDEQGNVVDIYKAIEEAKKAKLMKTQKNFAKAN